MKTPIFWSQKQSIISLLLIPFSYIWLLASFLNKKKPKKFNIPVIKIGNVVAGGAGKTPTAYTSGGTATKVCNAWAKSPYVETVSSDHLF